MTEVVKPEQLQIGRDRMTSSRQRAALAARTVQVRLSRSNFSRGRVHPKCALRQELDTQSRDIGLSLSAQVKGQQCDGYLTVLVLR